MYEAYMKELPRKLKEFEDFLGDKKFFVSDAVSTDKVLELNSNINSENNFSFLSFAVKLQPTFPDFAMYELLDQHRAMDPKCLDNYKKLKSFLDRFEVRKYVQSRNFQQKY